MTYYYSSLPLFISATGLNRKDFFFHQGKDQSQGKENCSPAPPSGDTDGDYFQVELISCLPTTLRKDF